MSGNFDFPPANTGRVMSVEETSNIIQERHSQRNVDTQRNALRHRLDEVRRLRTHMHDSDEHRRLRLQQSAVREEIRRRHIAEQADSPTTLSDGNNQTRPSISRLRFGAVRHRNRPSPQSQGAPIDTGGSMQMAVERLNEASSNLSSLLDQPIPRIGSPELSAREYSGEAEVNRRRKRRKLDTDTSSTGHLRGFSYGYRGQVVPGRLRMHIASCDGGVHREAERSSGGNEYYPDNVLRNDKSVYCTNDSKCNIILRHFGETTFDLTKLVIKAPERGFTAPIQEGMIFVSMTAHDILERTAQYQMRHLSPLQRSDEGGWPTFVDNADENRPLSRRRDSASHRAIPPPISDSMPRDRGSRPLAAHSGINNNDIPLVNIRDETSRDRQIPNLADNLGFRVETSCEEPSSDEEEPSSAAILADLRSRDRLPPPYDMSTDEDTEDGLERAMRRAGRGGIPTYYRRSRRRTEPRRIDVEPPVSTATADAGTAKPSDLLLPHAKFFIEKERSVVTIKFDPPVSGKYILLKLWSPAKDQNIDIQSIVAHGFSGLRFFPSVEMM